MVALTLYPSLANSATLTHAELLVTASGASGGTAGFQTINTSSGWGELGMGGPVTWAAAGSIGAPSGHGALFDGGTSSLTNQQIFGNWSASYPFAIGQSSKSVTATLVHRIYKYNTSTLVYTAIGSLTLTAQVITSTTGAVLSFPSTAMNAMSFFTNETAYLDLWANVTANSQTSGGSLGYYFSNSNTLGWTSSETISPGFTTIPPFSRIMGTSGMGSVSPGGVMS